MYQRYIANPDGTFRKTVVDEPPRPMPPPPPEAVCAPPPPRPELACPPERPKPPEPGCPPKPLSLRGLLPDVRSLRFDRQVLADILDMSLLTCAQQSAMNFGILLVQRLVDSFGPVMMAAFAAAVKIDSFAYLPVQDFGNAFSTFVAQNYGAGQRQRIRRGFRDATLVSAGFSALISLLVCVFAQPLMRIFVQAGEVEVLAAGVRYLRIEGACYVGIGCLFLLYGFYRAVKRPGMSVVLTVISLGVRVALAYLLAGPVGEIGIWAAIPIGWALADVTGYGYYLLHRAKLLPEE